MKDLEWPTVGRVHSEFHAGQPQLIDHLNLYFVRYLCPEEIATA